MPAATLRAASTRVKTSGPKSYWRTLRDHCPTGWIPTVAYYRASSEKQDTSVDDQRKENEAAAAKDKYCILTEYIDDGISGDYTALRIAFLRMIADVEEGGIEAIHCWDQDRFGRFNSQEAGYWSFRCTMAGAHLKTIAQGVIDWKDFTGRLVYNIQQEGKNQLCYDIGRNATRGHITTARDGRWVSGRPPIGYQILKDRPDEAGRLILGEESEIDLVLKIFNLYDAGHSLRGICDLLNKDSRHPRTDNQWGATSIRHILTTPYYTGDFIWPLTSRGRYFCARDGEVSDRLGEVGQQITIPDNHPTIISRELFDRVNDRLIQSRAFTTPHRNGGSFLFTGMIFCQNCGSPMSGCRYPTGNVFYRCNGHQQKGDSFCHRSMASQDEIMTEVLVAIEAWAADPRTHAQFDSELDELLARLGEGDSVEILSGKKAKLDKQIVTAEKRLVEADDDIYPLIKRQLKELLAEQKALKSQIDAASTPASSVKLEHDKKRASIMRRVKEVKEIVNSGNPILLRNVLRELITKIEVKIDRRPAGSRFKYNLASGDVTFVQSFTALMPHIFDPDNLFKAS